MPGAGPRAVLARMSSSATTAPPHEIRDFPDWVPAMVVKELRQGLRNRIFIVAFLALHSILVLNLLATIADNTRWGSGGTFWVCITFALAWLLPARNLSALSDELKHRTLDTLVLTRLSAWRIVAGKWASTAAQILLLGISVIPYLIMRYLTLGVDLPGELAVLGLTLLAGLSFTAMITGMSATGSWLARTLLVLMIGGFLVTFLPALARTGGVAEYGPVGLMMQALLPAAWITVLTLAGGASVIAPVAENHATLRRAVTLGMLIASVIAFRWEVSLLAGFATPALVTGMLLGLADAPNHLPVIHAPFVRRGLAGRIAAIFFTPGPSSGLVYALVMALLWLWGMGAFDPASALLTSSSGGPLTPRTSASAWFFVASLMLPALLLCASRPAWRWRGMVYFLLLIILNAFGVMAEAWGKSENLALPRALALGTPASLFTRSIATLSSGIALTGCWTALLLLALRKEFANAREMQRLVSDNLNLV